MSNKSGSDQFPTKKHLPGSSKWPFWVFYSWPLQGFLGDLGLSDQKVTNGRSWKLNICWNCNIYLGGGFIFFYFHPYLGKWSNLTNIFQMGWNHQLEYLYAFQAFFFISMCLDILDITHQSTPRDISQQFWFHLFRSRSAKRKIYISIHLLFHVLSQYSI